jgi:hypothetical protein
VDLPGSGKANRHGVIKSLEQWARWRARHYLADAMLASDYDPRQSGDVERLANAAQVAVEVLHDMLGQRPVRRARRVRSFANSRRALYAIAAVAGQLGEPSIQVIERDRWTYRVETPSQQRVWET